MSLINAGGNSAVLVSLFHVLLHDNFTVLMWLHFCGWQEWFVLEELERNDFSPRALYMGKLSLSCAWGWPCRLPVGLIFFLPFLNFKFYFETGSHHVHLDGLELTM